MTTLQESQPESVSDEGSTSNVVTNGGRKRSHPTSLIIDETAPPNKRLHTPTEKEERETIMREKQALYKAVAEAEKSPFFLHPHQQPIFHPFFPLNTVTTAAKCNFAPMGSMYSLLPSPPKPPTPFQGPLATPATGSSNLSTTNTTQPSGLGLTSSVNIASPQRPYPSPLYPAFMKYPFSPPTPNNMGLLSPWNQNNGVVTIGGLATGVATSSSPVMATSTPKDSSSDRSSISQQQDHSKSRNSSTTSALHAPSQVAPSSIQHLMSPRSIQSPLSYFHHPSPLSPMMFIHSPYANSVSSCPSVSSSSGCSSEGGLSQSKRYAPSEYHVGLRQPLSEKYADEDQQSEGASNSGRNTPIENREEESGNVMMPSTVGIGPNPLASATSAPYTPLSSSMLAQSSVMTAGPPPTDMIGRQGMPFSVESFHSQPASVTSNTQSYLTNYPATGSVERPSSGVSSMSSSLSSRDSTPDPEDHDHHHVKLEPKGSDIFCLVPGRLSLLSSTQKYKVSVDEVRRRLSHPECLNASVLGGILRRAKSKNGGHALRQRLESIGLSLPPGRRKATELSLLTSLVEGESLHLSTDFRRLCENFFPNPELAQIIARQHAGTPQAQDRISMVKATQLIVSELQAMLNAVGGPSNIKPTDPNNPYPGLTNFSLISHGFGNPAINTSLDVLQNYLQELLSLYEGRKPIQPDNRYMYNDKLPPPPSVNSLRQNPVYMSSNHSVLPMQNSDPTKTGMSLKQEPVDSPNSCSS